MLPSLRKRNNGCQAVIGQRVAALIAEQDGHRLAENAGKHFRMQLFGQLPVTAAGQLREQCMCISFPLCRSRAFPLPADPPAGPGGGRVGGGDGAGHLPGDAGELRRRHSRQHFPLQGPPVQAPQRQGPPPALSGPAVEDVGSLYIRAIPRAALGWLFCGAAAEG